jgi:hypothetical protein
MTPAEWTALQARIRADQASDAEGAAFPLRTGRRQCYPSIRPRAPEDAARCLRRAEGGFHAAGRLAGVLSPKRATPRALARC